MPPIYSVPPSRFAERFDRIYILNLPERSDRRQEMLLELQRAGFPAPGDHLQFFPAHRPADPAGFPSLGARGCFLSHLAMLKAAQKDNVQNLLVLEDDLAFSPQFPQHDDFLAAAAENPAWHFAYYGHVLPLPPANPATLSLDPCTQPIVTLHFYALRALVFQPLIAWLESILTRPPGHPDGGPMHVDGAYSIFRQKNPQFTTLIANPSLGHQRSSRSDIAPLKWFDRTPLIKQTVSFLRHLKSS